MKELIVNNYPKSAVAEAVKHIRTNLKFSSVNNKVKTILITSSISGEGKSFVSANLATTFANSNEKVLLIDCDLRRGRQHEVFNLSNSHYGLSNMLIDKNWSRNLSKYLKPTEIDNLDLLTAGATPPNSSVLLESDKMEEIVNKLKEKYDTIIFDTPPVGGLNDALVMTRLADVVLIVARAKKTTEDLLENTKEALTNVNANIAGVVLNRIDAKGNKYYHNYYYYS